MDVIILVVGIVCALVVVGLVVHLVLTWADRRGWVWYRNVQRPPPHTLGLLEEIYHPAMHHVIDEEVRESTEADQDESGAPPEAGRG